MMFNKEKSKMYNTYPNRVWNHIRLETENDNEYLLKSGYYFDLYD